MQEINTWLLSNQDFEAGKALYEKYGKNSFFKTILSKGPTPYSKQKLEAELKAMAPATPAIKSLPPQVNFEIKREIDIPEAKVNLEDAAKYLELKANQQTLYRQLDRNMAELDQRNNSRVLLMTAKQILSLHAKIRDIWAVCDYYDEKGLFPNAPSAPVRSPAEEIQLLRVSTWKAKERLKNPNCRDVEQTNKLIESNKARIIALGGKVKS